MGPAFSSYLNKHVGLAPSLVFGAMLTAIMPLVCAYNPHFMPIFFANALSVIGSAILGMSQGLLVRKLLRDDQRSLYYAVLGFVAIIPFLLIIPAGAWVAQTLGLILLFKILASVMLVVATPIYFILVLLANRQRL
jgi:MFS family permease